MRFRWMMLLSLVAVALSSASSQAYTLTLSVIGGPGLDQGEWLPSAGPLGSPVSSLVGNAPVTGSITYDSVASTVDFTLTLAASASFAGTVPVSGFLAGTTVSAVGVPVISAPLGGGAFVLSQSGVASGTAALLLSVPSLPVVASTPAISGLTLTIGTGADQLGVSVGPGGLTVGTPPGSFDAFLTYNVNIPEPRTVLLLTAGLAGLAFVGRRRA
jgi:hypothetical protein